MKAENSAPTVLRLKNKGGAPKGNRNAFKHGRTTRRVLAARRICRSYIRYANAVMDVVNAGLGEVERGEAKWAQIAPRIAREITLSPPRPNN